MYCFKNRGAIFAQAQKLVEPLRRAPSINDFVNPLLRHHEYSARGGRAMTWPAPIQNEQSKLGGLNLYKRPSHWGTDNFWHFDRNFCW